ncbi:MAG: hypothetical protein JO219_05620 [Candidatus Eremiobacteraeota bacterium]|nr:hypothetical protein [Candidatus Eremiobacteraeota bacterium]
MMSASSSPVLNVNVTCLACDGSRPCAQCSAAGRALSAAGHRVIYSSRYATLRAAADGSYGFPACVIPLQPGERSIADAIVALFDDTRVALATDDTSILPASLPSNIIVFPRRDFIRGTLPGEWLAADVPSTPAAVAERAAPPSLKSDATRRLRAVSIPALEPAAGPSALLDDELAWYRASGIGFALLSLTIPGETAASASLALGSVLRIDDRITPSERGCVAILAGANATRAQRVAARLSAALRKASRRKSDAAHAAASEPAIGIALCPHDGTTANALLAAANRRPTPRSKNKKHGGDTDAG